MLLRAIAVWLVVAAAETVHGIIRVRFLNRQVGDRRARQIGVFSGSLIIVAVVWSSISWVGVSSVRDCLGVGLLWSILMLAFDLSLGRIYFGFTWKRLISDFDPRQGGFLGFGVLVLFLSPLLAADLRGIL